MKDKQIKENTQNTRTALYRVIEDDVSLDKGPEPSFAEAQSINDSYMGNQIHSPMSLRP